SLCHVAQHFAAHAVGACFAIGHDTARSRHNGNAQTIHNLRNGLAALVNAQPWTGNAVDTLDDRTASVVFKGDLENRLGLFADDLETVDIAFVFQHGSNSYLKLRGGHAYRRFVDLLRITHTGQHVGDGIAHAHVYFSYQLALVMPG